MTDKDNLPATDASRVLIVEDDHLIAEAFRGLLEDNGFVVTHVASGLTAQSAIQHFKPDVVVLDLLLPDMHGRDLLNQIQQQQLPVTVVVVTSETSAESAVELMHAGAFDYIVKPIDESRLVTTVRNAVERQQLQLQLDQLRFTQPQDQFHGFTGSSLPMQAVYHMIESAAYSQASVFITGESGTGKELCADAIHQIGNRCTKPMLAINCAAIPRELLESELFGHTKGAFTGATSERKGAAAAANGGTLFFDEICDMDLDLQAKLLRFIQSKRFRRVGSDKDESTDVRFICATNRDPLAEVHAGRFREDLYYRLHVIPIALPALRDRGDDILMLARHFLHKYADEEGKRFDDFGVEARQYLLNCSWPGNVRELQNLIHKVVIMNEGGMVDVNAFDSNLNIKKPEQQMNDAVDTHGDPALSDRNKTAAADPIRPLWVVEKEAIERAIALCDGNIVEAATHLGVSDSTIYRKRRKWLEPD